MTIQTALLPHKHVRFSDSIIALAGLVRSRLVEPMTVDELWSDVSRRPAGWPGKPGFTHVVLALDVLFALGQVEPAASGRVRRVSDETD
jgi:hypothetical protein